MNASLPAPERQISLQFLANRRRRRRRRLGALVVVIAGVGGAYYWMAQQKLKVDASAYLIETIGYGDIENVVAASGRLWPAQIVPIGARESGQIVSIYVEVGDFVEEGQPLALIDPTEQTLRLESSQLSLDNLRNQIPQRELELQIAENDLRRTQMQFERNAATEREFENARNRYLRARTDLDSLMSRIQQSETRLGRNEVQLDYTEIKAPLSGTVVALDQQEGATLNASQTAPTIMRIADLTSMTLEAEISEADIGLLDVGFDAYFTLAGGDRRWYATLSQILPRPPTRSGVVSYTGRFEIDNSGGAFLPGMTAQVFFVTSFSANVLTVPAGALRFTDTSDDVTRAIVQVVLPNGRTEDREVVIGATSRVKSEVVSGLEEGERVIVGLM